MTLVLRALRRLALFALLIVLLSVITWAVGMLLPVAIFAGTLLLVPLSLTPGVWRDPGIPYLLRPVYVLVGGTLILAALGPARAFVIWTTSYLPDAETNLHFFAVPFIYWLGPEHLPMVDIVWGIAGTAIAILVFGRLVMWDRVRLRQIRLLRESPIHAVAQGLARVGGTVRRLEGGEQRVISLYEKEEGSSYGLATHAPFYLDDGTGRLLVEVAGASVILGQGTVESPDDGVDSPLTFGSREIHLYRTRSGEKGARRYYLEDGDRVTVIGPVSRNPLHGSDEPGHQARDRIRPPDMSFWKPAFYNMYLVADQLGEQLTRKLRTHARNNLIASLLVVAGGLWLMSYGIRALDDPDAIYGPMIWSTYS